MIVQPGDLIAIKQRDVFRVIVSVSLPAVSQRVIAVDARERRMRPSDILESDQHVLRIEP